MITTTTTTRNHRGRRVTAAVLVGLGLVSLGVASASRLDVTANGDLVASGATTSIEGFLGPDATADVKVTYPEEETWEAALAEDDTLSPTVTLTITHTPGDSDAPHPGKVSVYFYYGTNTTPVAKAENVLYNGTATQTVVITEDVLDAKGALPVYDRVAVVAVSDEYNEAG